MPFFSVRSWPLRAWSRIAGAGILAALSTAPLACSAPPASDHAEPEGEVAASQDQALAAGSLTRTQAQTVLKLIDDICGDTWCEGDNNFKFHFLFCSPRAESCTLVFQTFPYDTDPSASTATWHSCRTNGYAGFDSLVTTASSGYQSLREEYYVALSTCISDIEASERDLSHPSRAAPR